jgi:hypothetical protein
MIYCGGCENLGSHRRHCHSNPDYTREREWADQAEHLGDNVGPNNMAASNLLWRAAGLLNKAAQERLAQRAERIYLDPMDDAPDEERPGHYERIDVTDWKSVGEDD